jgi:hypothetical protein
LRSTGRVSMSGTFFKTDSAELSDAAASRGGPTISTSKQPV